MSALFVFNGTSEPCRQTDATFGAFFFQLEFLYLFSLLPEWSWKRPFFITYISTSLTPSTCETPGALVEKHTLNRQVWAGTRTPAFLTKSWCCSDEHGSKTLVLSFGRALESPGGAKNTWTMAILKRLHRGIPILWHSGKGKTMGPGKDQWLPGGWGGRARRSIRDF